MPSAVAQTFALGAQWPTVDPFLFVAHHRDDYPSGNDALGPDASLAGRQLGQDFADVDGWNMYHGRVVPGFPAHPHRGFETITYVRRGVIDHSDSLGATARFGSGDTQWMTAGRGIVHAEMFPLLDRTNRNGLEMFQIWLNLPAADKMVDPYFTMLWSDRIPTVQLDADGDASGGELTCIVGCPRGVDLDRPLPEPPPNSWAARPDADVGLWHLRFEPGGSWELPSAEEGTVRVLYVFDGSTLTIDDTTIEAGTGALVDCDRPVALRAGDGGVEILVLQGRPLAEPVARYGPFVMNTEAEIRQAFADYQETEFGGWPWDRDDPVHDRDRGRFARHADGRVEHIDSSLSV